MSIRQDAAVIIRNSIHEMIPSQNVKQAIRKFTIPEGGRLFVIAVGSAAFSMAEAAHEVLGEQIFVGVIITKYGYMREDIPCFSAFEAAHPLPEEANFEATQHVLDLTGDLKEKDRVLFLLSGGASSLFELPAVPASEYCRIIGKLLACGADITEINTVRKHLSLVHGGRFSLHLSPAKVYTLVLSDIAEDPLDMVGAGPTYPDLTTAENALDILDRYGIEVSDEVKTVILRENEKKLAYADAVLVGGGRRFARICREICEKAGYETEILSDGFSCDPVSAGRFLGSVAKSHQDAEGKKAFIAVGGLKAGVRGNYWAAPCMELSLAAAEVMAGTRDTVLFSIDSSGSDGCTDAAGALVDGQTKSRLSEAGFFISRILHEGNGYEALKTVRSLIITGPTGTDVNTVSIILIDR